MIKFWHTIIIYIIANCTSVHGYNTMPPAIVPSRTIKTFNQVWGIGGATPYTEPAQLTTSVAFPAGYTYTSPPKITMAVIQY